MTYFNSPDEESQALSAQYGREVLFEIMFVGNSAKVTAIDSETGLEVSIVGPPKATMYSLKANAMRKLLRALGRGGDDSADQPQGKPGWYA